MRPTSNKTLSSIISSQPIRGISDYFSINRKIERAIINNEILYDKSINIAILSSFTINGIKETLRVQCGEFGVLTNFYVGGYNQYAQEILEPQSGLYKFNPVLVIIFIDTRAITGDSFFLPYELSNDERQDWIEDKVNEIVSLAKVVSERSLAKVILHNFEVPAYSPLGLIESKQEIGFIESIEIINQNIREQFKRNNQVFIFDYNAFCSYVGKQNVIDYKMYYLADVRVNPQYIPHLCKAYTGYIRAIASLTKKCIVLDLDNILWGGVVGEDGIEGIALGPTPDGRPFLEFQKYLLSFFYRGVILAINSKNNPADVIEVLREHPYMLLRERHFAAMRINWDDKVANMKSLAKEINIGLDSLVFIDDEQVNREIMREFLPEVTVVDMPKDPALYARTLMELDIFHSINITEEDKHKGSMYEDDKKRRDLLQSTNDLTEYLRQLDITVLIEEANTRTIPRISQLTQKTNQFNMTTRRYTEQEITQFVNSNNCRVVSVQVSDKFGNNGLTGLAIIEKMDKRIWRIDTFLLSCRIIGRKVEDTLLAYIVDEAKKEGAELLHGEFIISKKNKPADDFYSKSGFTKIHHCGELEVWEYDLMNNYPFPDFIEVIIK